jgi:glycerol-3-phosphate dehydrogenase
VKVGIIGGGINGLCCAWELARQGHNVDLYERDSIMKATSRASSKLLHGGLRYLENGEFRLVREALRERDAWIQRVPELTNSLRLVIPIYKNSRRSQWLVAVGLFVYDHLAGRSVLAKSTRLTRGEMIARDPDLEQEGLSGGYEFSDGQMDDYKLGLWVADQAKEAGVEIHEEAEVVSVDEHGSVRKGDDTPLSYDRVINVAGPWAEQLLEKSGLSAPYRLDLIRGSHLLLAEPCTTAYLLEVPGERRIIFVLPWKGNTIVGTTEVRQGVDEPIACSDEERTYLINIYKHYFPEKHPQVVETFAGLRPLIHSKKDPARATREYAIHRAGKLVTVFGGKWTTSMALARKISKSIQ